MNEVHLGCQCGKVRGHIKKMDPSVGTRIVCCCDDCQAFASFLKQSDTILDQYGGTDILQMPLSYLKIDRGKEQIKSVRLSAKGMHRWYTGCCNTPIGNTLGPAFPFIGLVHSFIGITENRSSLLGEVRAYVQIKYALRDASSVQFGSPLLANLRTLRKLIIWKFRGLNRPSVFFDSNGDAISRPKVLSD